ncbi:hypothetical protein TrRE_jg8881 [Triparma retinervis]|uniref:Uncharacterized protein n=1 Tax=Triparma retinervis TaxID=2557542 RepID=A0A9W6ZHW1_9STRA|nr:hypothetical protein TrRE_jg8881 [Triparma retinervis]
MGTAWSTTIPRDSTEEWVVVHVRGWVRGNLWRDPSSLFWAHINKWDAREGPYGLVPEYMTLDEWKVLYKRTLKVFRVEWAKTMFCWSSGIFFTFFFAALVKAYVDMPPYTSFILYFPIICWWWIIKFFLGQRRNTKQQINDILAYDHDEYQFYYFTGSTAEEPRFGWQIKSVVNRKEKQKEDRRRERNEERKLRDAEDRALMDKYGVDTMDKVEELQKNEEKELMKKYGVDKMDKVRDIQDKELMEKYGVDSMDKVEDIQDKESMEKYGVDSMDKVKEIQDKEMMEKYGIDSINKRKEEEKRKKEEEEKREKEGEEEKAKAAAEVASAKGASNKVAPAPAVDVTVPAGDAGGEGGGDGGNGGGGGDGVGGEDVTAVADAV